MPPVVIYILLYFIYHAILLKVQVKFLLIFLSSDTLHFSNLSSYGSYYFILYLLFFFQVCIFTCQDILHFSTIRVKYKVQFKFQLFNLLLWFLFYCLFIIPLFKPSPCIHFSRHIPFFNYIILCFKVSIFQRIYPYWYFIIIMLFFFRIQIILHSILHSTIQLHIQSCSYFILHPLYHPPFFIYQDTLHFSITQSKLCSKLFNLSYNSFTILSLSCNSPYIDCLINPFLQSAF